jgi:hypothetical protein
MLAAWESATMQNLSPLLSTGAGEDLWTAILAHRASGDVHAFAAEARSLPAGPVTREVIERAIDALAALGSIPAPPTPSAAPAATEE